MIKLIIFDWDDVFTKGSTEGYFNCYHKTLDSVRIHLNPAEEKRRILSNWGGTTEAEIRGLLIEHPELVEEASRNYEEVLMGDTFIDCLSVVDGTQEVLERLSKNYILTIATGVNPKLLKEKIMPKFGIPPVFSQIVSVYDVPDRDKGKPHPFMIEQILSIQNILPEEAVLVGDAKNDVLMARAAGVTPIVVLTGHLKEEEARQLEVEFIVPDVTHVEKALTRLTKLEGSVKNHKEKL